MVSKIISGGQTGADRAALDFAMAHDIEHGGHCPKDRMAEDGPIDAKYLLTEMPQAEFQYRTRANVESSDGTVLFTCGPLHGGSRLTAELAQRAGKPCLHLDLRAFEPAHSARLLDQWLKKYRVAVLNVAGPRASHAPDIYRLTLETLEEYLKVAV